MKVDVAYIPPAGVRRDYEEMWGTDDMAFFSRYDGLLFFRITPLGAFCLGLQERYTPAPRKSALQLEVLPNLELVVMGHSLPPAEAFFLDTYADRRSEAVWKLNQAKLLAVTEQGRNVGALRQFLENHSIKSLPETVDRFLADVEERTHRLRDQGMARLIECADPALAALIANDTRTRKLCLLAGHHHLVVPAEAETRFRTALRKLGYSLPKK
ncbi:helicase-associated domain-containing protein [Nitrosococcus halophilus]|uniref:helicase-associated domain-containing protein n=1 Tax=Nitrosococcus halophilus TaxID=133539 RepID=UPI000A02FFAF|nr:helicase-associated domain-containing protein [Nitrosococcus halophilus]